MIRYVFDPISCDFWLRSCLRFLIDFLTFDTTCRYRSKSFKLILRLEWDSNGGLNSHATPIVDHNISYSCFKNCYSGKTLNLPTIMISGSNGGLDLHASAYMTKITQRPSNQFCQEDWFCAVCNTRIGRFCGILLSLIS